MAPNRGYKRSWKNLLINKRYQLRFTLFMVGLSAVLMTVLGWWVMRTVNESTGVATAAARGTECKAVVDPPEKPVGDENDDLPKPPMRLDEGSGSAAPKGGSAADTNGSADTGSNAVTDEPPEHRPNVQIVESTMTLVKPPPPPPKPALPPDFHQRIVDHWTCRLAIMGRIDELDLGRTRILWVLIGSGIVLALGLGIYGIKTTHKVAGPLFKVRLYFAKMKDGRLDKIYNLRKGDQLVEFYEHFKAAHAGVVQLERDDIAQLRALIDAARASGGDPKVIAELEALCTRKEKALE